MRKRTNLIIVLMILAFVIGSIRSGEVGASEITGSLPKPNQRGLDLMTGLTLKESLDKSTWTPVNGTLAYGYTMSINPANQYEYLDVDTYVADPPLTDGYHPFYFDKENVPDGFWAYWSGQGVIAGATGWQGRMWAIINGTEPMFYLHVVGTEYHLVDGLQHWLGNTTAPLQISGDYPLGTYSFDGHLTDTNAGAQIMVVQLTLTRQSTVSVTGETFTIDGCGYIDLYITVNNVIDLYALDVRLSFDPTKLEAVDMLTSEALNPGVNLEPNPEPTFFEAGWWVYNEANNITGSIKYAASQVNPKPPASGSGDVAMMRFRSLAEGTSDITVISAELSDREGYLIGEPVLLPGPYIVTSQFTAAGGLDLGIIRLNAANVQLSWPKQALDTGAVYTLYRHNLPYFKITDTGVSPVAGPFTDAGTDLTFTDPVLGNVIDNYFYSLQITCGNGFESEASWQVGKFEFELFETNTKDLTWIGLVLEMPGIIDTADLAYHIEHNIYSGTVDVLSISRWNTPAQNTTTYIYPTGTAFGVLVKQPYRITVDIAGDFLNYQSVIWAQVGSLPVITQNDYSFLETSTSDFVWIVQPLEMSGIVDTTQLTTRIETDTSSLVDVLTISRYNGIGQNFTSGVFTTRFGYPYRVTVDIVGSTPVLWP